MGESVAIRAAAVRPACDDVHSGISPIEFDMCSCSVASTIAQPHPVDSVISTTPCMLLYPIGRARKKKEVAKAHVDPVGSLFEGKPIPPLYACMRV